MSADQPLDPSNPWCFLIAVLGLLVAVLALREAYRLLAPEPSTGADERRRSPDLADETVVSGAVHAPQPMRCVDDSKNVACHRRGGSA